HVSGPFLRRGEVMVGFAVHRTLGCSLALALAFVACSDASDDVYAPPALPDGGARDGAVIDGAGGGEGASAPNDATLDAPDAPSEIGPCTTTFTFAPAGRAVKSVAVTGEWNGFAQSGVAMSADSAGVYSVSVPLQQGLVAYKLVIDGAFELD